MNIGTVIVTHNSAATLGSCVASARQNGSTAIIVVDNDSKDASVQCASSLSVTAVISQNNLGFAAACNAGAAELATPYLFFLNPDAHVEAPSLAKAAAYLEQHAKVGAVGLRLVSPTGTNESSNFGEDISLMTLFKRKFFRLSVGSKPLSCGWVSGAALLIRREAFLAVRGFDPGFFLYWEDVDLCRRLRQAGWSVVFLPETSVLHQRGASLPDKIKKTRLFDASADRYFRKHYATPIWWLHSLLRRLYRSYYSPSVH